MRPAPCPLLAAALLSSVLATPAALRERYHPRTELETANNILSSFVVPLTSGWEYQYAGHGPPGDTWEAQQQYDANVFFQGELATLVTDKPNQAFSVLAPCASYGLWGNVTGTADWSVILDGRVLRADEYGPTRLDMLRVNATDLAHNLTVVLGPRFKGKFFVGQVSCRTLLDR
jgi:hypothetical protein